MTYLIYEDGVEINRIVADENFCTRYCAKHGYTYEMESEPLPGPDPLGPFDLMAAAYIEGVNEA